MNSVFLTRRAMLSSGVMLGLGALLAACGQQATNEAAATASTAPSESASASAAVSDAASASATPSPVITRGYSGGSKAPDGEYRKADGYGPAQNVPLPKAEPQQYPETFAGLREMMRDWIKARNYGIQTGDMQYVWPYMLDTFDEDIKFLHYIEDLYKSGGWVIGGVDHFLTEGAPWSEDGETYFWKVYREWDYETYVESDGSWRRWENKDKTKNTFKFELKHNGVKWEIMNYEHVEEQP